MRYAVLLLCSLLFINCNNSSNKKETITIKNELGEANLYEWYILENGSFNKIDKLTELISREMIPWTIQERISDFTVFNNYAIAAVNGFGISIIKNNDTTEFEYLYDKEIYQYNTITRMYPVNSSVLCHFYFNSVLNIVDRAGSHNTMQYFLSETPEPVDIPFKKSNPDWEIVSIIPAQNNCFYLEWKHTENNTVNFRYSKFSLNSKEEELITRDEYRSRYEFKDYRTLELEKGVEQITEFIIQNKEIPGSIHFLYKTIYPPFLLKFSGIENSDNNVTKIKIVEENSTYFALLSDQNEIIANTNGNIINTYTLPELPEGFYYMDFIAVNGYFIISWEEIDFFNVGASGILVLDNEIL